MSNLQQGIAYLITGNRERGKIQPYHSKPEPLSLNKTDFQVDIAGLKSVEKRSAIKIDGASFVSKFTIGFEVEKNSFSRGAVKEYELFCGFETDRSCGYEAVTHILPLLPSGKWRNKVFDMMIKASRIIEDVYSPSNDRCGGHITIGVDGMSGEEVREAIRKNCGVIYAMFRKRLGNDFCNHNPRMLSMREFSLSRFPYASKYLVALPKSFGLEFRLPSRFQSVKQMMRRYELMYTILDYSINNPNGSHKNLLKRVEPILMSMYEGNAEKVEKIKELSEHFRNYILTGKIHEDIRQYVRDYERNV